MNPHQSSQTSNENTQDSTQLNAKSSKQKTVSPHLQPPNPNKDSIASGMLFSSENVKKLLDVEALFEGKMVHFSFDCPTNLRKAFVNECRVNGTSACKEEQKLMASYVATSRMKRHALGNTMSKLVDVQFVIERMDFNQYVQSRPRRYLTQTCEKSLDPETLKVEKTKKPVIVTSNLPDYSEFSTERLKVLHKQYWNLGQVGKSALVFAELNNRGQEES